MSQGQQWMHADEDGVRPPTDLRTDIPHPARMYDYFLGGKDNFPADREAAEQALRISPEFRTGALANRAFLQRAVRHVAREGVRQFLDIGTGIPTAGSTHQIAAEVAPDVRVAYLDNDPIVLVHGRALLAAAGRGNATVIQADLRDPEKILADEEVRAVLDFDRPIALMLVSVLHFLGDDQDPVGIVRRLTEALPSGSRLVLSHATGDFATPEQVDRARALYANSTAPLVPRTREQVAAFFEGLDLEEPGLVTTPLWRPDGPLQDGDDRAPGYAAVGVKP
ncbi:SAM-dependent methyltransferase [Streptacidiphilus sp. ASG 303]|uniref:SAM-dependent methyltransferase n=1 Tax=Streptomycetaceae TaxID=2062 RepID=UPI001E39CE20|nr:SAM-dependent methyltransferase [Streptacidiphilus sp. ASG 303]MCD0481542.1 SAM-dependent methyltransferase [Streptacidiphilus sp. ASG 303]